MDELAIQNFNGGVIFVSYLVSALGAMTALELLSQRTHYKGVYNWSAYKTRTRKAATA